MKICSHCEQDKPESAFNFADLKNSPGRLRGDCKPCQGAATKARKLESPERYKLNHRYATIKHRYGMTRKEVDAKLKEQNFQCVICPSPVDPYSHIDHCHTSGINRGILCRGCNLGLGYFRDSPAYLRAAADYLER